MGAARAEVGTLSARSGDTDVPITLFLPPGSCQRPLVAHVYGAYGISLEGPFDPFTDDLLSRGIAIAYCHVRGGGELGMNWHRQATGVDHDLTIRDLVACLSRLRENHDIDADRIVLSAASAGGLMAAAACLREPGWLRGLMLVHPFLDPLAALLDENAALSTTDWAEYGDPRTDMAARVALDRISPMQVVERLPSHSSPLPRAWIRAADHDFRVDVASVERFSRMYRDAARATESEHVVLRTTTGSHLGGEDDEDAAHENLLAHAWMIDALDAA